MRYETIKTENVLIEIGNGSRVYFFDRKECEALYVPEMSVDELCECLKIMKSTADTGRCEFYKEVDENG